jgi:hypothetical protein
MGSRTNFGIATYRHNDLSNTCIVMPSMSQKYFYPTDVQRAIIDNAKIDIQKALESVSGWEGDSREKTAQEYLPTIILLQGDGSKKGSFVINYLKSDSGEIYYRIFSFKEYKTVDINEIETALTKEAESGIPSKHSEEHENLIRSLLIF